MAYQGGAPIQVASAPTAWSSGLCGCFDDCGICCYGWCLAPCLYGDNVDRLTKGGCFGPCMLYFCCPCFACIYAGKTRTELRQKYNLPPEPCSDCIVHFCCSVLGICQEAREIKKRGL